MQKTSERLIKMFINLRGSFLNLTDWWRQAVVVVATVVHPHLKVVHQH